MHSIYIYTDIYQGLKIFANSCIYIYIYIYIVGPTVANRSNNPLIILDPFWNDSNKWKQLEIEYFKGSVMRLGDWARVRAKIVFGGHGVAKLKSARSIANLLQSLQSALETSTLLLESSEGIFLFCSDWYIFSAEDLRFAQLFICAQCLDTLSLWGLSVRSLAKG